MNSLRFLGLISIIVLGAIFIQEWAVRFVLPDFNPNNHVKFDPPTKILPTLGPRNKNFRLVKNSGDYNVSVVFNRHGFRDSKDVSLAQNNDVVVVGDSFAFGWGVEEGQRVSERLEGIIRRKVYNISSPSDVLGYGKLLEYAKVIGADIKDVVILFNMSNDIGDYDISPKRMPQIRKEGDFQIRKSFFNLKKHLAANSALYHLITNLFNQNDYLRDIALKTGIMIPLTAVAKRSINDHAIMSTINNLKRITRGYREIVVLVPHRGIWIGKNKSLERKIHTKFIKFIKISGLRFIDMRKHQEFGGNPMRFHFRNDGHWNPSGHKLAAEVLASDIIFKTTNRQPIQ